tara:strand:- start:767 stop:934 length:168 start_codon:yes stop_codon:yes gene_type:complete
MKLNGIVIFIILLIGSIIIINYYKEKINNLIDEKIDNFVYMPKSKIRVSNRKIEA